MPERLLRALTALLVLGVAGLAFVVSFEAITAFAVATGAFPPALGWSAPLLVDTFTVAATLVIWSRSLAGLGAGYARTLVAAATAVSLALNVAHAPDQLAARLVAALQPLALLAAVELDMSEARRALTHPGAPDRVGATLLGPTAASAAILAAPAAPGSATTGAVDAGDSRSRVRVLLAREQAGGSRLTGKQVAAAVGIKPRRAQELLRERRAEASRTRLSTPPLLRRNCAMTSSQMATLSPPDGSLACRPVADSPAAPPADPASNLRIGDRPAAIPAGHGGIGADANVADSRAVMR